MRKVILSVVIIVLMFLSGCSPQDEKKVVIASKPMSEQYIIVEMLTYLIEENTDIIV